VKYLDSMKLCIEQLQLGKRV